MRKIFLLLLIFISLEPVYAQPNPDMGPPPPWMHNAPRFDGRKPAFSPWEYMKKEDQYITQQAKLTMIEASSVCTLLHKMKDDQRNLDRQCRELLKQSDNDKLSESSCKLILNKVKKLNTQKLQVENNYMAKMLQVVSAKKLLQVLHADRTFDRMMLRQLFMEKHKDGKGNKGDDGPDSPPDEKRD